MKKCSKLGLNYEYFVRICVKNFRKIWIVRNFKKNQFSLEKLQQITRFDSTQL